jgi:hypothetical protein
MAIKATTETSTIGQFAADKDYYGETEDGRSYLKVAKGVTIPMAEAVELGVVRGEKPAAIAAEETDEKAKQPASNKAKTPAENK